MRTRSVPISVGRRPGMLLNVILMLLPLPPAKGADVVITVSGTVNGYDRFPIFGVGKKLPENMGWDLNGQPFTLVFTFDDTKGHANKSHCPNGGTGRQGEGKQSPGTAILTIGKVSYKFGDDHSNSAIYREVPGPCSSMSFISMNVAMGRGFFDFAPQVDLRLSPGGGSTSLTQDPNWESSLSTTKVGNQLSCFFISKRGQSGEAKGCFDVKKLDIKGPSPWWWPF
jgi:hypothetical protein